MKRHKFLLTALALGLCVLFTPSPKLHAQSQQAVQKLEELAKQLKLKPQQKAQLAPILEAEAPKLQAIKSNPSLTGMQKMEQLKAIHEQTDPQVKAILTPKQYEKWQAIRQKEVQQAIEKKTGGQ